MSGARRKVVHYGESFNRAACSAWLGPKAKKSTDHQAITCTQCRLVLGLPSAPTEAEQKGVYAGRSNVMKPPEHRWAEVRRDGEAAIAAITTGISVLQGGQPGEAERWVHADLLVALATAQAAIERLLPATWILDGNTLVLEDDKPVETPSPEAAPL